MSVKISLVLLALLLTGCTQLGYVRSTVPVDKGQLAVSLGQFKYEFGRLEALAEIGCAMNAIPEATCQRADRMRTLVLAHFATLDAMLRDPGKGLDLEGLLKALPMLSQFAGTVGLRLAPLVVP